MEDEPDIGGGKEFGDGKERMLDGREHVDVVDVDAGARLKRTGEGGFRRGGAVVCPAGVEGAVFFRRGCGNRVGFDLCQVRVAVASRAAVENSFDGGVLGVGKRADDVVGVDVEEG